MFRKFLAELFRPTRRATVAGGPARFVGDPNSAPFIGAPQILSPSSQNWRRILRADVQNDGCIICTAPAGLTGARTHPCPAAAHPPGTPTNDPPGRAADPPPAAGSWSRIPGSLLTPSEDARMYRSAVRKMFAPKSCAPVRRAAPSGLRVESLEERAVPATLTVDADGGRQYVTIQAAVNAAGTNDTVLVYNKNVAPGAADYQELVNIPAGKTGLKLKAAESGVVLGAGAGTGAGDAVIDIMSTKVTVEGFKIDGTGANLDAGVRITGGGAATVKSNTITNVVSTNPLFGIGVQVGTQAGSKGTADIRNNTIAGYSGAGVLVDGSQANATVFDNAIVGRGAANAGVDQFGVQVSRGASARVEKNDISGNTANNSAGVFVLQTGKKVVVAKNDIFDNGYGIYFQEVTGDSNGRSEILNNDLCNNDGFAALVLDASTRIDVKNNDLNGGDGDGILLTGSDNNSIRNNKVRNFAGDGIYLGESDCNEVKNNDVFCNGLNGIEVDESNNNWLWNNTTSSNAADGMTVKNSTGNDIWLSSSFCNVEDGISLYNADCTTIVGNYLGSNGGAGLRLVDSQNVFIAHNLIQNNGGGAIVVDSASTYCSVGNRTDEGITVEEIGATYNSQSYLASLGTTVAESVVAAETDSAA